MAKKRDVYYVSPNKKRGGWDVQKQGRWKIYGINLPDEVLKKIYYKNAEKVLKIKLKNID